MRSKEVPLSRDGHKPWEEFRREVGISLNGVSPDNGKDLARYYESLVVFKNHNDEGPLIEFEREVLDNRGELGTNPTVLKRHEESVQKIIKGVLAGRHRLN